MSFRRENNPLVTVLCSPNYSLSRIGREMTVNRARRSYPQDMHVIDSAVNEYLGDGRRHNVSITPAQPFTYSIEGRRIAVREAKRDSGIQRRYLRENAGFL